VSAKPIKTAYIVGAGFSSYAGLPLTTGFTNAMLAARNSDWGPSRLIVDFVSRFTRDTFNQSIRAAGDKWPDLEDIFTCVDLAANSGHHLGSTFAPADLRTVRRAILSRTIRMLEQHYATGRKRKNTNWFLLERFFSSLNIDEVGFISMNWDNVIERKIQFVLRKPLIDYGCDALPIAIPDIPIPEDFGTGLAFMKALKKPMKVVRGKEISDDEKKRCVPLIKIHGSINWLYCDNCRRLFWCHPDQALRIADQLITDDDLNRMERILGKADTKNSPRLQSRH
jgi:hypothetical protein